MLQNVSNASRSGADAAAFGDAARDAMLATKVMIFVFSIDFYIS
jgi:hypothetical protein